MTSNTASKPTRKKYEPVDDRLLATAGRCFLQEGFGFGIDDILAQAGVAKMSLYGKFGSKYGLIERLLSDAALEWRAEIDLVTAEHSLQGPDKIMRLLKVICSTSRDTERRTGLIGQALIEFPLTGKEDETHKKKDQVHEKARELQRELLKALERLCSESQVPNPAMMAQEILLLANSYLIMEPLLGKTQALKLTLHTAENLIGHLEATTKQATPKPRPGRNPPSEKSATVVPIVKTTSSSIPQNEPKNSSAPEEDDEEMKAVRAQVAAGRVNRKTK